MIPEIGISTPLDSKVTSYHKVSTSA